MRRLQAVLGVPRLGIYGGTFDPPHRGHLFVAREAHREAALDALLWVPARCSPHKAEGATPGEVRAELVELCLVDARAAEDPAAEVAVVWRGELERPGPSYTVETVRALVEAREGLWRATGARPVAPELVFVMGADQLDSIERWAEVDALFELARPVVVDRASEGVNDAQAAERRAARLAHLAACAQDGRLAPETAERLTTGCLATGRLPVSSTALRRSGAGGDATTPLVAQRIADLGLYVER